ncbi:hypothetical protein HHI36_008287, partial [Cryptolaemus montrouzieri]
RHAQLNEQHSSGPIRDKFFQQELHSSPKPYHKVKLTSVNSGVNSTQRLMDPRITEVMSTALLIPFIQ